MIFAGISNEPWLIPSAWRASTTTWLGLLRMRLASSRAGTHSPMRPNRIGRGGPPVLGMADWPTQTRLRRLLIRSRGSGGTTPAHVAAARSSRSAAWAESLFGRRYRVCCDESAPTWRNQQLLRSILSRNAYNCPIVGAKWDSSVL